MDINLFIRKLDQIEARKLNRLKPIAPRTLFYFVFISFLIPLTYFILKSIGASSDIFRLCLFLDVLIIMLTFFNIDKTFYRR